MSSSRPRKSDWELYVSGTGAPVFKRELEAMPPAVQAEFFRLAELYANREQIPRNKCEQLRGKSKGLIEFKIRGPAKTTYRVIFAPRESGLILLALSAFHKKSPTKTKTPPHLLKTARQRLKEWDSRHTP